MDSPSFRAENKTLFYRYVTILPPVHLGINIDTDIFSLDSSQDGIDLLTGNQAFPSVDGTVKLEQALGSGEETTADDEETRDPEYYHNALACVILGVVVMIILFFVCKFLNDLQVKPRSGRGRKRTRCGHDGLVESVPISLKGHKQVCVAGISHRPCTLGSFRSRTRRLSERGDRAKTWNETGVLSEGKIRLSSIRRGSSIFLVLRKNKRCDRLKKSKKYCY